MITEDMNEAADEYAYSVYPSEGVANIEICDAFKRGAEWKKEQMMKESVEHYVVGEIAGSPVGPAVVHYDESLNIGDKVRIIIVREEDK